MVTKNDLYQPIRKPPLPAQDFSALAVSESEIRILDFSRESSFALSALQRGSRFLREDDQIYDVADVVHQAREIGFFWIPEANRARQLSRNDGASQGVLPEEQGIESALRTVNDPHQAARNGNVSRARNAQCAHCAAQGIGSGTSAEQCRVRHTKALRRQGFVPANNLSHAEKIDRVGRLVQFVQQGLQYGGNAGNRSQKIILAIECTLQRKIGCGWFAEMMADESGDLGRSLGDSWIFQIWKHASPDAPVRNTATIGRSRHRSCVIYVIASVERFQRLKMGDGYVGRMKSAKLGRCDSRSCSMLMITCKAE